MIYNWFYIINKNDFDDTGLVSQELTLELENVGQKTILVTKGIMLGITYEGIFLPLQLNDENPFEFEDHAIQIDDDDNIFLGIAIDED